RNLRFEIRSNGSRFTWCGLLTSIPSETFEVSKTSKVEFHHHIVHHIAAADVDDFLVDLDKTDPHIKVNCRLIVFVDVEQQAFLPGLSYTIRHFEDEFFAQPFSLSLRQKVDLVQFGLRRSRVVEFESRKTEFRAVFFSNQKSMAFCKLGLKYVQVVDQL